MNKIRIMCANTPTARVFWRLPNWFYFNVPTVKPKILDYRDELRQQAAWDAEKQQRLAASLPAIGSPRP